MKELGDLGKWVKAQKGAVLHSVARGIFETPFAVRTLMAPKGWYISNDGTLKEGKIVRYSGRGEDLMRVLVTNEGTILFPQNGQFVEKRKRGRERAHRAFGVKQQ